MKPIPAGILSTNILETKASTHTNEEAETTKNGEKH